MRKKLFMLKVTEHGNRLFREDVEAPSLERSQTLLTSALLKRRRVLWNRLLMIFELINSSLSIWAVKALTLLIVFYSSFVVPCSISVRRCVCFWRYLCLCLWRSGKLWASVNCKRDFASQIARHAIMFPCMLQLSFFFWRCQSALLLVSVWNPCLAQPHCVTSPWQLLCSTKRRQPTLQVWSLHLVWKAECTWGILSNLNEFSGGSDGHQSWCKINRSSVMENWEAEQDFHLSGPADY